MNCKDEEETLKLTYDLIKQAVHGDEKALEKILRIYDPYINSVVSYERLLPSGEIIQMIDEDMKIQVQMKLVDAIQTKWRELI
ncbi:MAG: helix-turn-helix domain-containing protein [Ruminococcus flavefaciens]|nr:helix-turn-helix domain-containing protein [Ruminococcus flavefaciens]